MMELTKSTTNSDDYLWKESTCQEIYYVTVLGHWYDIPKKIWETDNGDLFQIDRTNFLKPYGKTKDKHDLKRQREEPKEEPDEIQDSLVTKSKKAKSNFDKNP